LTKLLEIAAERGVEVRFDPVESVKHHLRPAPLIKLDAPIDASVDICFALGGDGTILNALRTFAGTSVPVFAINFGEMGFLATVDREDAWAGSMRALAGDFEVMSLPAIELSTGGQLWKGINDVSIQRHQGKRVADLDYSVGGDEVGRVRCDGLVVSTPAGSTGYNLANGGPVMAWGVQGMVVSFIAPHSFSSRPLVVAPGDRVSVGNRSQEEPVDVIVDGRPVAVLEASERLHAWLSIDQALLAQVPGTTFYQRLRKKFGRLATPL
jgi:NAD+ kinase